MAKRDQRHSSIGFQRSRLWLVIELLILSLAGAGWFTLLPSVANWLNPQLTINPSWQSANPTTWQPTASPRTEKIVTGLAEHVLRVAPKGLPGKYQIWLANASGGVLFQGGNQTGAMLPASTTKLLTALAVLSKIPPQTRFSTKVFLAGKRLYLVGGGDPMLQISPAATELKYPPMGFLTELANQTARKLGAKKVTLSYQNSLFSGPAFNPKWPKSYLTEAVTPPIQALWSDWGHATNGWSYLADPSAGTAGQFAALLRQSGVNLRGEVRQSQVKSAPGRLIAEIKSPTVAQQVAELLEISDNGTTEVLLRQLGIATSGVGSTAAGVAAIKSSLAELGIPMTGLKLYDGSGLSRQNRIHPETLLAVLGQIRISAVPAIAQLAADLPVARFSGSLAPRFSKQIVQVRAKTGSLTGVVTLAGYLTPPGAAPISFVVMVNQVPENLATRTRNLVDRLLVKIAGCACFKEVGSSYASK